MYWMDVEELGKCMCVVGGKGGGWAGRGSGAVWLTDLLIDVDPPSNQAGRGKSDMTVTLSVGGTRHDT